MTTPAVRCPFHGIRDGVGAVSRCPGFSPVRVEFHDGPGAGLPVQTSCAHLAPEPGGRGFIPACHHPVQPRLLEVIARLRCSLVDLPWPDRDALPAALIAVNAAGAVTQWNAAAEQLYGWPREEVWGKGILDVAVGPDQAAVATRIMEQLAAGLPWQGEFECRRRNGEAVLVDVVDLPLMDAGGAVVGVVGLSAAAGTLDADRWTRLLSGAPRAIFAA